MTPMDPPRLDACALDVHAILQRTVASLYSHLVTRPTGRAVRQAIETQLGELPRPALTLVDLSSVSILDYSCADEVVAKLLLREIPDERGVFIVLTGMRDHHRDPIEAVLERHRLAVVAEVVPGGFDLIGTRSEAERTLWWEIERRRRIAGGRVAELVGEGRSARLEALVQRRVLFRDPLRGDLHALSTLVPPPRGPEPGVQPGG